MGPFMDSLKGPYRLFIHYKDILREMARYLSFVTSLLAAVESATCVILL
jgi:hypothetical protein